SNSGGWLSNSPFYKLIQIDGYEGIQVVDGVILVPMNLNVSGSGIYEDASGNKETFNTTETSNGNGVRNQTGIHSNPNVWCSTLQPLGTPYTRVISGTRTSTGSVNWGVYVSNTVASGTYDIRDIFIGANYINAQQINFNPSNLNGSSISVWRPLECSISPPSTVNFGTVNVTTATNNDVLTYSNDELTINCSGDNYAEATVSITGTTGRYSDTLKMTWLDSNNINSTPAEIRGFIGYPLPAGECNGTSNGYTNTIIFDTNLNKKISIGKLSSGSNTVPYSFSLCSNGNFTTGAATANATINVNWD
ncbi:hypothetical protein Q4S25_20485, partial [Morganella morganii]